MQTTIADLIRTRLDQMEARQSDLRRELERIGTGVSRQTVNAWCTGKDCPSDGHLLALWQVFAVAPSEHLTWITARAEQRRQRKQHRNKPEVVPVPEAARKPSWKDRHDKQRKSA